MKELKSLDRALPVTFFCVTVAGAILHDLFKLWPSILTEFVTPVNESIWEHLKIVFWPLLSALPILYGRKSRSGVLAAILLSSGGMLLTGWLIHIVAGYPPGGADILLYVLLMGTGCILPACLPVSEDWFTLLLGGVILLAVLLVAFSIMPPDLLLFHDASLVDAWVIHPC